MSSESEAHEAESRKQFTAWISKDEKAPARVVCLGWNAIKNRRSFGFL